MATKEISITQARVGMYVSKLDIAWFKSPFFSHARAIANKHDIFVLKECGIKTITIDTSKGVDVAKAKKEVTKPNKIQQRAPMVKTGLKEELGAAKKLKSQAQKTIKTVINAINQDKPVVAKTLDPLVNDTLESINRNDQALLTLLHMEQKGDALITHSFSVMSLSLALGKLTGLSDSDLEALGQAALMHDVGWSKLPHNLYSKGQVYTPAEEKLSQQHVTLGLQAVEKGSGISTLSKLLIAQHHEFENGSGYPLGLTKEKLHPAARLLCVIDAYDEIIHGLANGPGMVPTAAIRTLYQMGKEGKLDLKIVTQLVHLLGVYPLTSAVELNTGEKAVVTEINRDHPLLPVVTIFYNHKGTSLSKPKQIDLSKQKSETNTREINGLLDLTKVGVDPANMLRPSI
ncbi:MAG: DUF3391 domain-containing protein [Methylococcales bacterium]|jgi:HD-GYP domain-containing protein (c-di-GMP phosphodiesterase class II)|nr:DUF3391 domain-containing protein [Methylococcales bacterium]